MARFRNVGDQMIPFTPAEEAQADLDELAWTNRPTLDQIDQDTINKVLIEDGSIVRALAEFVFRLSKGQIPIDPTRTSAQFRTILKSFMRT